jgi:hypothetical protein
MYCQSYFYLFFYPMLTHRRHRYLTRWPRRLAFALAIALLLAAAWHSWRAQHPAPVPPTTLA